MMATTSDEEIPETLEHSQDKDWGPEMSPWKRRAAGAFIVAAFLGVLVAAVLTAGR